MERPFDGGPAFPLPVQNLDLRKYTEAEAAEIRDRFAEHAKRNRGPSLLDYAAIKIAASIAHGELGDTTEDGEIMEIAERSYKLADALIVVRNARLDKREQGGN